MIFLIFQDLLFGRILGSKWLLLKPGRFLVDNLALCLRQSNKKSIQSNSRSRSKLIVITNPKSNIFTFYLESLVAVETPVLLDSCRDTSWQGSDS